MPFAVDYPGIPPVKTTAESRVILSSGEKHERFVALFLDGL
jgi:hypothetical protein